MSVQTFSWPAGLFVQSVAWRLAPNVRAFPSPYTHGESYVDYLGERFVQRIRTIPRTRDEAPAMSAFFNRLLGVHWVSAPNFALRTRRGTVAGSPVLTSSVAQGAQAFSITTSADATFLAGDCFAVGAQFFEVAEDVVANGSGVMALQTTNRARAAMSANAAVVWNSPTTTWSLREAVPILQQDGIVEAIECELWQAWE